MKIDPRKVKLARARACMTVAKIVEKENIPRSTVNRAINGGQTSPETAGRIARALGVDVAEIIVEE